MREPTQKMKNTIGFILYWIEDNVTLPTHNTIEKDIENLDENTYQSVYNFIGKYFNLAKLLKDKYGTRESRYSGSCSSYSSYEPPREGQRRYYADDIETYKGGQWVSKVKEDTCRFHDKPSSPSSGLPRTKYDEPEYTGHHW